MLTFFNKTGAGSFIVWERETKTVYVSQGYMLNDQLHLTGRVRKISFNKNLILYNDQEQAYEIAQMVCEDWHEIEEIVPTTDIKTSDIIGAFEMFRKMGRKVMAA